MKKSNLMAILFSIFAVIGYLILLWNATPINTIMFLVYTSACGLIGGYCINIAQKEEKINE